MGKEQINLTEGAWIWKTREDFVLLRTASLLNGGMKRESEV